MALSLLVARHTEQLLPFKETVISHWFGWYIACKYSTKGDKRMDMFNIICGVCSIAGLLVSIFTASKVIKISNTFYCGNSDDHSETVNEVEGTAINGTYVGRDSINETRSRK